MLRGSAAIVPQACNLWHMTCVWVVNAEVRNQTMNLTVDDLLRATANADRSAFNALYAACAAKLFGIAMQVCRERGMAEDALQESFVEIWRKSGQFDPQRGRAEAWMAVIVRNRAVDLLRQRGRNPSALGDSGALTALAGRSREGGETEPVEYLALLACLDQLQDQDREAVLLAYYEGASREELSRRYEAPVNTIKARLRRALAALRTCLGD